MQLTHWPRPQTIILHFIQLTDDKYDVRQQLHKCSYGLKFKILGQKSLCMSFCLIFISYDNITSLNVILYNSSVNKKLILCYILTQYYVFLLIFSKNILALKPQQNRCASLSNTALFSFWMNQRLNESDEDIYRHLLADLISYFRV